MMSKKFKEYSEIKSEIRNVSYCQTCI